MILIDLSSPRRFIANATKDLKLILWINEDKTKKCKFAAIGTLAAMLSFNNSAAAESLKNTTNFIDSHLYPNLFALCEIMKQTSYSQVSLAIKQIRTN